MGYCIPTKNTTNPATVGYLGMLSATVYPKRSTMALEDLTFSTKHIGCIFLADIIDDKDASSGKGFFG